MIPLVLIFALGVFVGFVLWKGVHLYPTRATERPSHLQTGSSEYNDEHEFHESPMRQK